MRVTLSVGHVYTANNIINLSSYIISLHICIMWLLEEYSVITLHAGWTWPHAFQYKFALN